MGFEFDWRNFGLGLAAGWGSAFLLYQSRQAISRARSTISEQATTTQASIYRSAEGRYTNDLLKLCQHSHLAGDRVELTRLLVEPRFLAPPPFSAPPDDDVSFEVFHVVPKVHDHPYLHAPFNIETLSIEELSKGERVLALLGMPGSGRTTALQTIALYGLGQIDFKSPKDQVQLRLEAEEAAMDADARAKRIKERMTIEERARERLAMEQGETGDPGLRETQQSFEVSPFKRMMPVYVHLANVLPEEREFGKQADPAEPLIRAVQHQVRGVTAKTVPRRLYERLNQGRALLLLDGYDDLPLADQRRLLPWLAALIETYRRNFIIVAGPAQGYGGLLQAGLTPVFLRPWSDKDFNDAAEKWAGNWGAISKARGRDTQPDPQLIEGTRQNARGFSPFDLSLKLWSGFGGEADAESSPADWVDNYLKLRLKKDDSLRTQLAQMAALQLDEGFITHQRLVDLALGRPAPAAPIAQAAATPTEDVDAIFSADADEDVDGLFEDDDAAPAPTPPPSDLDTGSQAAASAAAGDVDRKTLNRINNEQAKLLDDLEANGMLVRYKGERGDDRYQFQHRMVAAYLASVTLLDADDSVLALRGQQPAWEPALAYTAAQRPIDAAVRAHTDSHPDVLYNHLLNAARWLAFAGEEVAWRSDVLKRLGNLFISPNQYPLLRERIAAGLVGTRDRSAMVVFQRGLQSPDADIRRLSCLAIGALQEPKAINALAMLLRDDNPEVQLSAGLGLGAIGTEQAYEAMVIALTSGSEKLRQAVAETFAAIPDEGYPILYDAVNSDEMMLRRAAVFGLRRVRAPWALIEIYRVFLEDSQWYVRSAAQQAFLDMRNVEAEGLVRNYPRPESIEWLREWLATRGEEEMANSAEEALASLLEEGDGVMQAVSAMAIGQLGMVTHVGDLYAALLNREAVVRDAAHRALADLQVRLGQPLPAPA